jgi:hypothetical protein
MKLIKDEVQTFEGKMGYIEDYNGVCHICNSPIEYYDRILVVNLYEDTKMYIFAPLTILTCPNCNSKIESMLVYKDMEITQELLSLKEK